MKPKSYIFLKLPVKGSTKDLRTFHLLFLVKVADSLDQHSTGGQPVLDRYQEDREAYQFKTQFIARVPLYDERSGSIVRDGLHKSIQLYQYDHETFESQLKAGTFYSPWQFPEQPRAQL